MDVEACNLMTGLNIIGLTLYFRCHQAVVQSFVVFLGFFKVIQFVEV